MMKLGQYSVVSYTHALRGERINLGILVWHPTLGYDFRFAKSLQRIHCIDENAETSRVQSDLTSIQQTITNWKTTTVSPLEKLSIEFRFGVQVSTPQNARIHDPGATLERLYLTLLPPEPGFIRASTAKQFSSSFATALSTELEKHGVRSIRKAYKIDTSFQPVSVALGYERQGIQHLWRTCSFASEDKAEDQLRIAKAFYAENADLKSSAEYKHARLFVAAQSPKPRERGQAWTDALDWLKRGTQDVEIFEDRASIPQKVERLGALAA